LFGGPGEDDITGGHNVLFGDDGHDTIDGGDAAQDTEGDGADVILGDNGLIVRTVLDPVAWTWLRYPAPFADVIREVERFDDIDLISGNDTIYGDGGQDILLGQRGDDVLEGDGGDDELVGHLGTDTLRGGDGYDFLVGDSGVIHRDFTPSGLPRLNENGSWHRDVVLEELATLAGTLPIDRIPLRTDDPDLAAKLIETDLLVLAGSYNADGSKQTREDTGAWASEVLLVNLVPSYNDTLEGGGDDDVLFGQRGNDVLRGGADDDLIFGDGASNVTAFPCDKPNIFNGIRLIGLEDALAEAFTLPPGGLTIVPHVNLLPEAFDMNTPFLAEQVFGREISSAVHDAMEFSLEDALPRADGTTLRAFVTLVPDVVHHTEVLPGNDTIDGGDGADRIVGDNATIYSPLISGLDALDAADKDARRALTALSHSLARLAIDYDHLQQSGGSVTQPHDVHVGEDRIEGGDGHDLIFGDDLLLIEDFLLGVPVPEIDFAEAALDKLRFLQDLERLATDLEFVAFESHFQVVRELIEASNGHPPLQSDPDHHDLFLGNDTITDSGGNNVILGDQGTLAKATVRGGQFDDVERASPLSVATWETVKASLAAAREQAAEDLAEHRAANRERANRSFSPADLQLILWDCDYELFVGNDSITSGGGNDLVVGDFGVFVIPVVPETPGPDEIDDVDNAVHDLILDIGDFFSRRTQEHEHEHDFDVVREYYDHAFFAHRGGHEQEVPMDAGNDTIDGQGGEDWILGDWMSLFATLSHDEPDTRLVADRPNLTVKGLIRKDFELDQQYSYDEAVSTIGHDTIHGGDGNDALYGQDGDDMMYGDAGDDLVFGGGNNDTVDGGPGRNDVRRIGRTEPRLENLQHVKDMFISAWTAGCDADAVLGTTALPAVAATANNAVSASLNPWQNPLNRWDVNADLLVTPLDALIVINDIDRSGSRSLVREVNTSGRYLDTNGDGFCSSLDVLFVSNYLNSETQAEGEPPDVIVPQLPPQESSAPAAGRIEPWPVFAAATQGTWPRFSPANPPSGEANATLQPMSDYAGLKMPAEDRGGRAVAVPRKASFDDRFREFDESQGFWEVLEINEGLGLEWVRFQ